MEYKTRFPQIEDVYLTESFLDYEIQKSLKGEFSYRKHFNDSDSINLPYLDLDLLPYNSMNIIDKDRIEKQIGEIHKVVNSPNACVILNNKPAHIKTIDKDSFTYFVLNFGDSLDENKLWHKYKFNLKYNEYEIVYCMVKKLAICFKDKEEFHKEYNLYKSLFKGTEKEFLNCLIYPEKLNGYPCDGNHYINFNIKEFPLLKDELCNIKNYLSNDVNEYENELDKMKKSSNVFIENFPLNEVIEHFSVFYKRKDSINNKPYLTQEQFNNFIRRAFIGDKVNIDKQTFTINTTDKGFVILRFYEFYQLAIRKNITDRKKKKFIDLILDNFTNWERESEIINLFKGNKVKKSWE